MTKINFSKLEGKLGKATKLAGYLTEVSRYAGKPNGPGHKGPEPEAYEQLMIQLVGSNEWYSASAPAIDMLLSSLQEGTRRDISLALVADIAGADHLTGWLEAPGAVRIPSPILEVLARHRETFRTSLRDNDEKARAAAAMAIGCIDGFGQDFRLELLDLAQRDNASQVRASAALALGRLGEGDRELSATLKMMSADDRLEPLVRGAAAIAWLRATRSAEFYACAGALADWLTSSLRDGTTTLHWFGAVWKSWKASGQVLTAPARALSALAHARGAEEEMIQIALDALARHPTEGALRTVSNLVLELGGFLVEPGQVKRTLLPSEFNPFQQRLLPLLARSVVPIAASFGLPAAGANRRRWLGLEPPGPLERTYAELGDEPLWKACQSQTVELPHALTGLDRWKAMIELCAQPYAQLPARSSYHAELHQLVVDPSWYDEVSSTIDEVTSRADIANLLVPRTIQVAGYLAETALLPLLRAGLPVRDSWVNHAWLPSSNLKPEVLQLLPPNQREQLLHQILSTGPNTCSLGHIQFISLSPTRTIVDAAIVQVQWAKERGHDIGLLLSHLTALIPEHPFVLDALHKADLTDPS